MKRLSYCRPIVYITVNRPQRMNTSSIWRGRKRNAREREVGNVGADLGGVYQRKMHTLWSMTLMKIKEISAISVTF